MVGCNAIALRRLLLAAAAIVLVGIVAGIAPSELIEGLAYLFPAVLLLAVLAARRYPGERALIALVNRRRDSPRRAHAGGAAGRARPRAVVPRGGRLIATSLAVRPPPALAAVLS